MVEITYAEENLPGQIGLSSQVTGKENGKLTVFIVCYLNLGKQNTKIFYLVHKITFMINVFKKKQIPESKKKKFS